MSEDDSIHFLQRNCDSSFNCKIQIAHIDGKTTIHSTHSQIFGVYYSISPLVLGLRRSQKIDNQLSVTMYK